MRFDAPSIIEHPGKHSSRLSLAILDLFGASGGVGRCTREILRQLDAQRVPTMLCGQSHVVDSLRACHPVTAHLRWANLESPKFSLKSLKLRLIRTCSSHSAPLANTLLQQTSKAARAWDAGVPTPILVNYPQIIAPPTGPQAFCILLHDLNWRPFAGNFENPARTDRHCRGWVERAFRVITNSECTREEIIQAYGCPGDKVVAAPLAPFMESVSPPGDYLAKLGLERGRFYLSPGVWGLHKGQDTLTEALEKAQGIAPVVVTCGLPGHQTNGHTRELAALRASLAARWENLILRKKLVVVRGVSEPEMQALRDGCLAYVLPTRYEGFGFPLAEAIYQHRPAIASDLKAHRELLNRYPQYQLARLFPPDSSSALVAAMDRSGYEPTPAPTAWRRNIESTWSWKNTLQRILSAMNPTAPLEHE